MPVLRVGPWTFRLHAVAGVVTLLAIVILVKLGNWQISRGQEKQFILDRHQQGSTQVVELTSDNLTAQTLIPDQQVRFTATFTQDQYLLVDNQTLDGKVGYHVIGLARIDGASAQVPVNLGWAPAPVSRQQLPSVELPTTEVTVVGRVRVPAKPFLLAKQNFANELPQRIQYLEINALADALERQLTPFSVLLNEDQPIGFPREWPIVVMEPHRHYAYAVQWYGLAIAAFIVFLVASREKPQARSKS